MTVRKTFTTFFFCFAAVLCLHGFVQAEEIIVPAMKDAAELVFNYRATQESKNLCIRPQDEIWVINARRSHYCPTDLSRLSVTKLCNGVWRQAQLSELTELHQVDQSHATVLHVHGWRSNREEGIEQTFEVYKNITTKRRCTLPLRWVLWQWKSDKDNPRYRTDYIEKSKRALIVSTTLSATLAQFGDRNLTLLAHSLGNTVVLSAMVKPTILPETEIGYRLVIVGAAIGCDFAHTLWRHRLQAVSQIEETVIINNKKDPVVSIANQLICRQSYGRKRLDLAGIVAQKRLDLGNVRWHEAAKEIGVRHEGKYYTASNTFLSEFTRLQTLRRASINVVANDSLHR